MLSPMWCSIWISKCHLSCRCRSPRASSQSIPNSNEKDHFFLSAPCSSRICCMQLNLPPPVLNFPPDRLRSRTNLHALLSPSIHQRMRVVSGIAVSFDGKDSRYLPLPPLLPTRPAAWHLPRSAGADASRSATVGGGSVGREARRGIDGSVGVSACWEALPGTVLESVALYVSHVYCVWYLLIVMINAMTSDFASVKPFALAYEYIRDCFCYPLVLPTVRNLLPLTSPCLLLSSMYDTIFPPRFSSDAQRRKTIRARET